MGGSLDVADWLMLSILGIGDIRWMVINIPVIFLLALLALLA